MLIEQIVEFQLRGSDPLVVHELLVFAENHHFENGPNGAFSKWPSSAN